LVWPAGAEKPVGLAGAGRAGSLATVEAVRSRGHATMPTEGPLTVTVPGTVEAWGRLVERFGRFGLAPLMAPAAVLARDGWIVAAADPAGHHSEWVDPISFAYRDLVVYELPPPTQGLAAAGLMVRLEAEDKVPSLGFARALMRARQEVYVLRDRLISDPDFNEVPREPFLDPAWTEPGVVQRFGGAATGSV